MKQFNNNQVSRGSVIIYVVVVVCVLLVALFGAAFEASQLGLWVKREPPNSTAAGGVPTGGCYLNDGTAFRDTNTINSADKVISLLPDYKDIFNTPNVKPDPNTGKFVVRKDRIAYIISESTGWKINPAILISFWYAEQSFGESGKKLGCSRGDCDDSKALGVGIYAGSTNRHASFEDQVSGALGAVEHAISVESPYLDPTGANTWTRLLYNYVGERKAYYEENGYVSPSTEARMSILLKLVPNEVTCETAQQPSQAMIPSAVGGIGVPILFQFQWVPQGSSKLYSIRKAFGLTSGPSYSWGTGMGDAGCSVTSMAMIVNYLNKTNILPIDINGGLRLNPQAAVKKYGLKIVKQQDPPTKAFPNWVASEIAAGHPVLWNIKPPGRLYNGNHVNSHGHYMVIVGIQPKAKGGYDIIVNDPFPAKGSGHNIGPRVYSTDTNQWLAGSRFWSFTKS